MEGIIIPTAGLIILAGKKEEREEMMKAIGNYNSDLFE